jgi:mannose-6-phosphate isomerase-like protein (cupin superfamily)
MSERPDWIAGAAEALGRIDRTAAVPFERVLKHGSMWAGLYAPGASDPQQPHAQDEVYVVVQGSGTFVRGDESAAFGAGDLMFVPAGVSHRFENYTSDFAAWVVFWGPAGGEVG